MGGGLQDSGGIGFGRQFTDHMAVARHSRSDGWGPVEIVRFGAFPLSPAAMVFHYGQAIFEGLKAFRQPGGGVALFRPGDHARRFDRSARRLAMPELDPEVFVAACAELVRVDDRWVPDEVGRSLYLRPMMIATEPALGVRTSAEYLFAVFASPVGSYFDDLGPMSVWTTPDYVRAVAGGMGSAKCAGNYAASLAARQEAQQQGCHEMLWLDAVDHRWIEELSGMNIVFVTDAPGGSALVTPPIGDTILDGVTRKSLLALGAGMGYGVDERPVALAEMSARTFAEAFACGTAAVVAPVGRVRSPSGEWIVGDGEAGPVTLRLRQALVALQEGRADDPFGWRVDVAALCEGDARCRQSRQALDFEAAYDGTPSWDIGRPQPSILTLAEQGALKGRVLDVGCGTGEHALLAASLGLDAVGIDVSPTAIAQAAKKAAARRLPVSFVVMSLFDAAVLGQFETVVDSGLFHVFDDEERVRAVEALSGIIASGGCCYLLCFSDGQPGGWPPRRVSESEIRASFTGGWRIDWVRPAVFELCGRDHRAEALLAKIDRC